MIALSVVEMRKRSPLAYAGGASQKRFLGINGGGWLTLETKWYPRNTVTTKTRFAVHWASSRVLWTALHSVPRS